MTRREYSFNDKQRKAFKDSKAGDFPTLEDGDYQSNLDDVLVRALGNPPEIKVLLKYRIFSPVECDGTIYTQFLSLENLNAMGILKAVLQKFGIDPNSIELDDVEQCFSACIGNEVHFTLKTTTAKNGKDYQNATITAVVKDTPPRSAEPIEVGDDIPF